MPRRDLDEVLADIHRFCREIADRIDRYGITETSVACDSSHADLILMPLCQIGEVVQRNRDDLAACYPELPWHQMAGLRNVIVHGYAEVDAATVWATAMCDIPRLEGFCAERSAE